MQELVSVIIPVYNSSSYIRECVESVLMQTHTSLEILLIDDGSQDNSGDICEELSRKDKRLCYLQQSHKGVSAARNRGLNAAKGKYLFFVDSDDIIHPQLIEYLYKLQEKNATVIATVDQTFWSAKGGEYNVPVWNWKKDIIENSLCLMEHEAMCYPLFGIGGSMILRSIVDTTQFSEQLTHGEDTLFLYQVLIKKAALSVLNGDWYYYRQHQGNVSNIYSVDSCKNIYGVWQYIRDQEEKNGRVDNAIRWEGYIIITLAKWYKIGAECDNALKSYAKKVADSERRGVIFSRLDFDQKEEFCLTFSENLVLRELYKLFFTWKKKYKKVKWNLKKGFARVKLKKIQIVEWFKWNFGIKMKWKIKRGIVRLRWGVKRGINRLRWGVGVKMKWKIKKGIAWVKQRCRM